MRACLLLPVFTVFALATFAPRFVSAAATAPAAASVTLTWSAPGDDGHAGLAWGYDLRYDIHPITSQNFVLGIPVVNVPNPIYPGNRQTAVVSGLAPNVRYYFAIRTQDERGNWSAISNVVTKVAPGTTVAAEEPTLTLSFSSPWPNPARASARVSLTLPQRMGVKIEAYDVSGRLVRTLVAGDEEAGRKDVVWDLHDAGGRRVAAGVYLLLARLGAQSFTRRITVTS